MGNFKQRWNIKSNWQVFVILLVFAITGSSAALLSKPILHGLGISKETHHIALYLLLYILIIFPVYQILLVTIGLFLVNLHSFGNLKKKCYEVYAWVSSQIGLIKIEKGTPKSSSFHQKPI